MWDLRTKNAVAKLAGKATLWKGSMAYQDERKEIER